VVDLDALPLPRYDQNTYPSMAGAKLKVLSYEESRGCRNRCAFCTHRSKAGNLRIKRPDRITTDLRSLLKVSGCRLFRLSGSYTPGDVLQQIADHLIESQREGNDLGLKWTAFGHVIGSGNVNFARIREAGCVSMLFGVESGSQRILDGALNKGTDVGHIRNTLISARRAGIKVLASAPDLKSRRSYSRRQRASIGNR
jgi:hypothetical protein